MGKVNKTRVKKESAPVKSVPKMKPKKPKPAFKPAPKQKLVKEVIQKQPSEKEKLDDKLLQSGIKALREIIEKQSKDKKELFDEEQQILLQMNLVKIPKCPARVIHFPLRHRLFSEESEICLITEDITANGKEHEKTVKHYEDLLEKKGVTVKISKIIPFRQLREEYSQHESKLRLMQLYDLFLVDKKLESYVLKLCGAQMKKQRKNLQGIKFAVSNLNDYIKKSLYNTQMVIHSNGNSFTVTVAHTKMSDEEISENIRAAFEGIGKTLPGGTANLRSLHVKSGIGMAIPIYLSLKQNSQVRVPVVKPLRPNAHEELTGELSTRNDREVVVFPSGDVQLKQIEGEKAPASTPTPSEKIGKRGKKRAVKKGRKDVDTVVKSEVKKESVMAASVEVKKSRKQRKAEKRKAVVVKEEKIGGKVAVKDEGQLQKVKKVFTKKTKQNVKKGKAK